MTLQDYFNNFLTNDRNKEKLDNCFQGFLTLKHLPISDVLLTTLWNDLDPYSIARVAGDAFPSTTYAQQNGPAIEELRALANNPDDPGCYDRLLIAVYDLHGRNFYSRANRIVCAFSDDYVNFVSQSKIRRVYNWFVQNGFCPINNRTWREMNKAMMGALMQVNTPTNWSNDYRIYAFKLFPWAVKESLDKNTLPNIVFN